MRTFWDGSAQVRPERHRSVRRRLDTTAQANQKSTAPGDGPEAVHMCANLEATARTSSSELPLDASPLN